MADKASGKANEEYERGCCWNCGLLGRRDVANIHVSLYSEINKEERDKDNWFTFMFRNEPRCYADHPIHEEIATEIGDDLPPPSQGFYEARHEQQNEAATAVIRRPGLDCPEWIQHKQGLPPVTHLGSLDTQRREEQRREWERLLSEDTKRFETQLAEDTKRFQAEIASASEKTQRAMLDVSKSQRRWSIAAVIAGAAIAAVTIMFTRPDEISNPLPVIVLQSTVTVPAQPSPGAAELTPTPSLESAPGTESPQP